MLAVLAYLRAFRENTSPQWRWLVGAFALFVAALLSHAVALSLPVVLEKLGTRPWSPAKGRGGRVSLGRVYSAHRA
jgi:hypothetical protein